MSIFGALGLGLTILVLQSLVPAIFNELQETMLVLLNGAQVSIDVATQLAGSSASYIPR